jgi:phosphoribosyl 1,2-cyclic phosphodiesterase
LKPLCFVPFEPVTLGDYQVTPYPANHGNVGESLLYSIELGQRAILYCTDTSELSDSVWDHLLKRRTRFDAVILDHTYGIGFSSIPGDHLASQDVAAYADRFRTEGLLKSDATVYATHISHEGYLEHSELDAYARKHGYRIAFDGLTLELGGE